MGPRYLTHTAKNDEQHFFSMSRMSLYIFLIDVSSSVQHVMQSGTIGEGSQEGFQHVVVCYI